ncbi:MAG: hypothetical protein K0S09_1617 [Sphingobacteriaceae bacterium]|jgi:uncharacterized SAM-binding protein YcdF (DUF218 family)|nr:hypothetical protein [Sphingobacteriaceae bacterium]
MFFFLSKLLVIFLSPFTWILLTLFLGIISKNRRYGKRLLITCLLLALIFSNRLLLDVLARAWDIQTYPKGNQQYSCAILLGGFASEDSQSNGYFNSSSDRFIQAATLYHQKKVSHILMSGGNNAIRKSKFREADYVSMRLRQLNVPDSAILIENQAKNTLENASFAKKMLEAKHLKPPYLLVTSAFHMRRSILTFQAAGIDVVACPSDFKAGNRRFAYDDLLPHPDALSLWDLYIKEIVGYLVYQIKL